MILPHEAVLEYQQLYKVAFGREITYEEAFEKGTKLLGLYKIIYRPVRKDWLNLKNNHGRKHN